MNCPGSDFVGQEVLRYLDHLAASNPDEYRAFMKSSLEGGKVFFQNAVQNCQPVDTTDIAPRWSVRCPLAINEEKVIHINVCGSPRMERFKPADGEVPLFMSPIIADQVDVVVHPDVLRQADCEPWFKQELVDLFTLTLKEQHHLSVVATACRIAPPCSSVLTKGAAQKNSSVLQSLTNVSSQTPSHPEEPQRPPWIIGCKPVQADALKEMSSKSLIQEVDAVPDVCETATHVNVDVRVECDTVQDIDVTIKSNVLRVRVGSSSREIILPASVKDVNYTAKYLKKKSTLRLQFEK
eukprot:GGOE01036446.1.p1 GENE.GGOE01036446.1~~GGOE01036446.1.p1  ORF type:complete len:295 (-),score=61.96 GGOE01036446.1:240-1124(-)